MRNIGLIGAYRDSVKVGVGERKGVTIHAVTTGEEEVLVAHRTPVGIQKLLCVWKAAKPQALVSRLLLSSPLPRQDSV